MLRAIGNPIWAITVRQVESPLNVGTAVLAKSCRNRRIGFAGVVSAFGLSVLTMASGIGHLSGCDLNPTLPAGLAVGRRFPRKDVVAYVLSQVLGACAGA